MHSNLKCKYVVVHYIVVLTTFINMCEAARMLGPYTKHIFYNSLYLIKVSALIFRIHFSVLTKFSQISFFNYRPNFDPEYDPRGSLNLSYFDFRWIAGIISFPTRRYTTIFYFQPYSPLTPNMTPNGSFLGPKTFSIRFLPKNRRKVPISLR